MPEARAYLGDGRLKLDNNICERSIRPVAPGRKNCLFPGSVGGGEAAAIAYALIETAEMNNVDPQAWLTWVLERVADHGLTPSTNLCRGTGSPKTSKTRPDRTDTKHRNLLGHAPKHMHEELTADYRDMIDADTAKEVEKRRKAFLRKWRLKCRAVADSLEEAADRLFTFTRFDPSQWKSARTTNAIERLNEEFRRRMKTQTVLPCAETVPMLLWALMASGQIQMRKVDG